jgi:hypothetical protein
MRKQHRDSGAGTEPPAARLSMCECSRFGQYKHTRAGVAQILCLPRKGHRLDFGGRPRPLGLDPCSPTSSGFICLARIHGGSSVNSRSSLTIANKSRQLRVAKLEPFAHPAGRIRADTME